MKTFELTPEETTTVLRWVPNLDADRKELFGSRPSGTMILHYDSDETLDIAAAQLVLAANGLRALGKVPPYSEGSGLPIVVAIDLRRLALIAGRFGGVPQEIMEQIERLADRAARAAVGDDDEKTTKH